MIALLLVAIRRDDLYPAADPLFRPGGRWAVHSLSPKPAKACEVEPDENPEAFEQAFNKIVRPSSSQSQSAPQSRQRAKRAAER